MNEERERREERVYTVEEADAALPDLRERLDRIRTARQELLRASEVIRDRVATDGGGHDGREYWSALQSLRADIEDLSGRDIILRDPQTGLVDFPAERDGQRVFLCWRLGEDRVTHWHDIETGFSGRRPL